MIPSEFIPSEPSGEAVEKASTLIKAIELACDQGRFDPPELKSLRDLTGNTTLSVEHYHEISGAMSYRDAAYLAFCPKPAPIPGLTFEMFRYICEQLQLSILTPHYDYWVGLFQQNARKSNAGDLLFHPPEDWLRRLKNAGEIDEDAEWNTFSPTVDQLAREAWRSDAILL